MLIDFMMKLLYIALFLLLINTSGFAVTADNSRNHRDFLDIVIDDSHAYTYLNCKNCNGGQAYIGYSSLMPKDASLEGIEDFPKVLQLVVKAGDLVSENTIGFTFKDVVDAIRFGFFYMISDYIDITVEGEISTKQPVPNEIRLRKRFYLTPQEARRAVALVKRSSRASLEGKIFYDQLSHNCVDYAKEIYEGIGLHETQGDFLSQLGLDPELSLFEDEEENTACTILKAYKAHNEGAIGFRKVLSVVWDVMKLCWCA